MLNKLIESGKTFVAKFTAEYNFGAEYGIDESLESEYIQWLAKVGVYAEGKLKRNYPSMTNQILGYVNDKSLILKDYNIIMGYLESVEELQETKPRL